MRNILILFLLLFSAQLAAAQANQVKQARNAVGKLQAGIANKVDKNAQIAIISDGLKAIDLAKANKKTKNWAETWAINAYLNSYRTVIAETADESDKYYQQAVTALDTAKMLDKELSNSDLVNAAIHNINIKKQERGNNAFKESDYFNAYLILKEISDFYEKDTTIALDVAISAQNIHQNEEALKYFKRAKDNGILNPAVYQNLATIYAAKLETDLAIKTLEEGITLNPANTSLRNDYINILIDNEKYDKALEAVRNELVTALVSDHLFFIYGFLLQAQNDPAKAEVAYRKAIGINPNYFDAFYQLGLVYLANANKSLNKPEGKNEFTVDINKAESALHKAYEINPNDKATISLLIEIYKRQNQGDKVKSLEQRLSEF